MTQNLNNELSEISQKELDKQMEIGKKLFSEEDAKKIVPLEDPRIYAFIVQELNDANNFCTVKIGDTYRTVNQRLNEWRKTYENLVKLFDLPSYVDIERKVEDNSSYIQRFYFRDYVIHRALRELGYRHLKKGNVTSSEIVYQGEIIIPEKGVKENEISEEFMIDPTTIGQEQEIVIHSIQQKIVEIIADIKESAEKNIDKYNLSTAPYNINTNKKIDYLSMSELDYFPYPYQDEAVDGLVDKFVQQYMEKQCELSGENKSKVLIDSPTRSGKTAMIVWALKKILYRIWEISFNGAEQKELIVFTTGIPDVFYEFQEFIQRHTSVKNFIVWLDKEDIIAEYKNDPSQNPIDKAWETHNVVAIGASLQYLAGRKDDGAIKDLHKIIGEKVSIVVADECHYGLFGNGESYKASFQDTDDESDEKLDEEVEIIEEAKKEMFSLNPKLGYIFASATTYNILDNDVFSKNNVVFVRQSDVDAERDKSFENLRKQEIDIKQSEFYGRPNRHFFGIDIDAPLNEIFEPTIQNNKTVFKNNAAYVVLDALFGIGDYDTVPPLLNNEVLKKAGAGRHILFQMSSKRACDALENYFLKNNNSDHPKLGYKILNTSSKNDSAKWTKAGIEDIKKEIYNNRFGKTVMITVNRGTTGVSIPQLDTEVLLNSSKSLVRRVQTYGRVNTPWVEMVESKDEYGSTFKEKVCYKPNTFVIDFDATSLYDIQNDQEIINNNTGSGNADKTTMGTFWKFNGLTLSEMTQLDIHRQLNEYLKREKISSMVQKIPEFEFDSSALKNILDGFDLKGNNRKGFRVELNEKGKEIADRSVSGTSTNDTDSEDDTVSPDDESTKEDAKAEEERLKKEELLRAVIWERTLVFALLDDDVNNIQSIVEKLHNSVNRDLINDLNMMFYLPVYEKILADKSFHVLDALERAIKSVRARCLDDYGAFFVEGFFECVIGLNRVSANEIFTPEKVAELLLDKAGFNSVENLKSFSEENETAIDNGDKSGIITAMFVKRLLDNGFSVDPNAFYSVPTSPITYQITYKVFKNLGLNTENILFIRGLDALTVNELLVLAIEKKMGCQHSDKDYCYLHGNNDKAKKKRTKLAGRSIDYPRKANQEKIEQFEKNVVATVLDNIFDKIVDEDERNKVKDFWEKIVKDIEKFDYAISNPPYQIETGVHKNGRINFGRIYDKFQLSANLIANKTTMIYPASWKNTISSAFVQSLIKNGMMSIDEYNGSDIFSGAIRKDYPVCIVCCVNGYDSDLNINGIVNNRFSNVWISSKIDGILTSRSEGFAKLDTGAYHLSELSNVETDKLTVYDNPSSLDDPVQLYIKQRPGAQADGKNFFIERKNIIESIFDIEEIRKFKVAIQSRVFKQAQIFAEILNDPNETFKAKVFKEDYIFAKTWINIKSFDTADEAENFCKYLNNRLIVRLLLLETKQKDFGRFVPDLEDYTDNNPDINWKLPLDPQLYKLFNLTEEEIKVIEES